MKLYPNVTIIFLIWILSVFAIFYFGFLSFPNSGNFSRDFFQSLSNWDGGHFLSIAENGYQEKFQYAFFPLYPMLIRLVNQIIGNYNLSAILISITCIFFATQLFYRLVSFDFSKMLAQRCILFLLFFPTSFYFLVSYSESLFLLLTVLTFYFLRQKKLFLATAAAILVSATRLVGLAVVLGFLIEVQLVYGFSKKNWYVLFAPLGFAAFCIFLYTKTGDPFYFTVAENHWQRSLSLPGVGFWEGIKGLVNGQSIKSYPNVVLDLAFAIFGLGLALRTWRFLPMSYSIYSLVSIAIPLLTPTLSSIPRFLLPIFPIFIVLALVKNEYVKLFYQVIALMLLSVLAILFINGYWVS
ncbi:hypothetical protein HYZ05_02500 [Candidatus Daviesbacteria bacterium]|nr:hypothetical protein [Candidatus Daviesbacteria bacterium]